MEDRDFWLRIFISLKIAFILRIFCKRRIDESNIPGQSELTLRSRIRVVEKMALQGEYICFLDADDIWTPDKLEVQVDFLERHPELALVFSDHKDFTDGGSVVSSFLDEKKNNFWQGIRCRGTSSSRFLQIDS